MRCEFKAVWTTLIVLVPLGLLTAGCGSGSPSDSAPKASLTTTTTGGGGSEKADQSGAVIHVKETKGGHLASPALPSAEVFPQVLIKTTMGSIRVKLNSAKAPVTVDNFLSEYVDKGFYDQTLVHYVERGVMVVAGGFAQDFKVKPTRTPILNEADNGLKNVRGTISMARDPEFEHSATSQFFFNLTDSPSLDYQKNEDGRLNGYCVFGEVVEGLSVLERMSEVAVKDHEEFGSTPTEPVMVESIQRIN